VSTKSNFSVALKFCKGKLVGVRRHTQLAKSYIKVPFTSSLYRGTNINSIIRRSLQWRLLLLCDF
jgi:hypothetical protein